MSILGLVSNSQLLSQDVEMYGKHFENASSSSFELSKYIGDSESSLRNKLPSGSEPSQAELELKSQLTFLQKYIQSYGAPEELNRSIPKILELPLEDEEEEVKKKAGRSFDPNSIDTTSQTIQDPENDEKIKVVVSKRDEEGNLKITRIMSFGGQNSKESGSDKVTTGVNESDDKNSVFGEGKEGHTETITKELSEDDAV